MKKLLVLSLLASPCFANGPKYVGTKTDAQVYQEFVNAYQDIKSVANGIYKTSSITLQGITVDSITVNNFSSGLINYGLQKSSQCTSTVITAVTGLTYVTALTCAITPTSSASRVKVTVTGLLGCGRVSNATSENTATIQRGSTDLSAGNGFCFCENSNTSAGSGVAIEIPCSMTYIDSPGTASSVAYNVGIKNVLGANGAWGDTNVTTAMILEEIK